MKKKKTKIGSMALVAIAVIGIVAGIEFILAPGIISSTLLTLGQSEPLCSDAPYNPSCICVSNENKKGVAWNGVQTEISPFKYYCEKADLLIDPESPTFEQDALNLAKSTISSDYPECNSIDVCPVAPTIDVGYTAEGKRYVQVQCRQENEIGKVITFWNAWMDIESHDVLTFCQDLREFEPEGENSITIIPRGYYFGIWGCAGLGCPVGDEPYKRAANEEEGYAYYESYYYVHVNCEAVGTGTYEIVFNAQEGETITNVLASGILIDGYTTQINGNTVTYTVPYTCGGSYGYNFVVKVNTVF